MTGGPEWPPAAGYSTPAHTKEVRYKDPLAATNQKEREGAKHQSLEKKPPLPKGAVGARSPPMAETQNLPPNQSTHRTRRTAWSRLGEGRLRSLGAPELRPMPWVTWSHRRLYSTPAWRCRLAEVPAGTGPQPAITQGYLDPPLHNQLEQRSRFPLVFASEISKD